MDRQARARVDLECMLLDETKEPKALPLSLLENITNNFSPGHKIGSGGFAVVYKGVLDNGTVAVKKLSNTYLYEDKFWQEIECLMKAKHKNIVRFLGYCSDTQEEFLKYEGKSIMAGIQERILCFEYVPKGDLLKYISDASSGLEWRDRYKIIKGICEGLNYLHTQNIVHLDLKPANILMDDKMVPKITDFGVSRCFKEDQTRTIVTIVAGTPGYLAPEFTNGVITFKYDLYALGVIIMEILTGAKGYHEAGEVLERWSSRLETSQKLQDQLDVYLVELRFPVRTNTDEHTVFRLIEKSTKPWRCFASLPLYGIVPSRFTTYTLVVTTQQQERLPEETEYDLILQSSLSGDKKIPTSRDQSKYKKLFDEAKESGSEVREMLKTVFASQEQTMSATISRRIKVWSSLFTCIHAPTLKFFSF
uniref:non-specific serine/threonine protein kinase n=1 Tax=Aegilops tauschii subsp. strangulata TaxID=200361 RepID=A0A453GF44_AEGTS